MGAELPPRRRDARANAHTTAPVADLHDLVHGREDSLPWVGQRGGSDVHPTLVLGTNPDEDGAENDLDGTSSQDRDEYTDTQDRDSYTVDPALERETRAAMPGATSRTPAPSPAPAATSTTP